MQIEIYVRHPINGLYGPTNAFLEHNKRVYTVGVYDTEASPDAQNFVSEEDARAMLKFPWVCRVYNGAVKKGASVEADPVRGTILPTEVSPGQRDPGADLTTGSSSSVNPSSVPARQRVGPKPVAVSAPDDTAAPDADATRE